MPLPEHDVPRARVDQRGRATRFSTERRPGAARSLPVTLCPCQLPADARVGALSPPPRPPVRLGSRRGRGAPRLPAVRPSILAGTSLILMSCLVSPSPSRPLHCPAREVTPGDPVGSWLPPAGGGGASGSSSWGAHRLHPSFPPKGAWRREGPKRHAPRLPRFRPPQSCSLRLLRRGVPPPGRSHAAGTQVLTSGLTLSAGGPGPRAGVLSGLPRPP